MQLSFLLKTPKKFDVLINEFYNIQPKICMNIFWHLIFMLYIKKLSEMVEFTQKEDFVRYFYINSNQIYEILWDDKKKSIKNYYNI